MQPPVQPLSPCSPVQPGKIAGDHTFELLQFRVRRTELENLKGLHFGSPTGEWQDFTRFHKENFPLELLHGGEPYDFVSGPMVGRIRSNG